jgi:hypothetical protein
MLQLDGYYSTTKQAGFKTKYQLSKRYTFDIKSAIVISTQQGGIALRKPEKHSPIPRNLVFTWQ